MINFREIFNSSYGYLFLGIIFVLFLILIFVKREIFGSFKVVSNILFVSGTLCLVISIVLYGIYYYFGKKKEQII